MGCGSSKGAESTVVPVEGDKVSSTLTDVKKAQPSTGGPSGTGAKSGGGASSSSSSSSSAPNSGAATGPSPISVAVAAPAPLAGSVEDKYTFGKVLGRGGFGEVRHATRKSDGMEVGIKIISKLKFQGEEEHQFMLTETSLHGKVKGHINVTELIEKIEDKGSFYMVLE